MEQYKGQITKIVFRKEEFGIAKFRKIEGNEEGGDEITVVGVLLPNITGRETLEIFGNWEDTDKYGKQLRIESMQLAKPTTPQELIRYLIDYIPGVGPSRAKLLQKHFGESLESVLDDEPERLLEVKGIGTQYAKRIIANWQNDTINRRLSSFLASIGVSRAFSKKIREELGDNAEALIRLNPYRLIEVHGIGFKRADEIAKSLGYDETSAERARCVLFYLLEKASSNGHVFLTRGELLKQATEECGLEPKITNEALEFMLTPSNPDDIPQLVQETIKTKTVEISVVYLKRFYTAEKQVAQSLARIASAKPFRTFNRAAIDFAIKNAEKKVGITLSSEQREAVFMALTNAASLLTGGPGTGKTSTLRVLVQVASDLRLRLSLAAPTGRAAKRMNEVTGEYACTLHRLLEFSPDKRKFMKDSSDPLNNDLVIVDECSMIDLMLAGALTCAIPSGCCVLFVGDPNQLPSVGAGRFLDDLLRSGRFPKTELKTIFRQAERSLIVKNAHNILNGVNPQFYRDTPGVGPLSHDCYFLSVDTDKGKVDYADVKNKLAKLLLKRIPDRLQLDPVKDVQVLVPQKKGDCGVYDLNTYLQEILNPCEPKDRVMVGGRQYRLGDRIMATKNNLEIDVSNGDIGFLKKFNVEDAVLVLEFYGREVIYPFEKANQLQLAYASTIHKSQGSEYKVVLTVILNAHYVMLQRNLLYTAATRAKQLLVFIGQDSAISRAVSNGEAQQRNSLLVRRIKGLLKALPAPTKEEAA